MKRPWHITNEADWLRACEEIVVAGRGILDRSLSVTEGARLLSSLRFRVKAENDKDLMLFSGIASETDAFPLGEVRKHWTADALARSDAEREAVEARWRDFAEKAATNLVKRYEVAA